VFWLGNVIIAMLLLCCCILHVCLVPQNPCHVCVHVMSDVSHGSCIQGVSEGEDGDVDISTLMVGCVSNFPAPMPCT